MCIVSMDAYKAFDRIKHYFLFETLEATNFGNNLIKHIKTIFNAPKFVMKPFQGLGLGLVVFGTNQ